MSYTQWEYRLIEPGKHAVIVDVLGEYGDDGWEFASFVPTATAVQMLLKRPVLPLVVKAMAEAPYCAIDEQVLKAEESRRAAEISFVDGVPRPMGVEVPRVRTPGMVKWKVTWSGEAMPTTRHTFPWWYSSEKEQYTAAVKATTETGARLIVELSVRAPTHILEAEERPPNWSPFNEDYPRQDWMVWDD